MEQRSRRRKNEINIESESESYPVAGNESKITSLSGLHLLEVAFPIRYLHPQLIYKARSERIRLMRIASEYLNVFNS